MTRRFGPIWAFVACAALAMLPAQEQRLVHNAGDRPGCTLTATVCAGGARPAGVGFVRLEIENHEARPRDAWVEVATTRYASADVACRVRSDSNRTNAPSCSCRCRDRSATCS